jgi:hypothetical protein
MTSVEAFESFVALALETEGLLVSEALKFPSRVGNSRDQISGRWRDRGHNFH